MSTYRAGIIGLGRMGWLYDAARYDRSSERPPSVHDESGHATTFPALREAPPSPVSHPGKEGLPSSYAEAFQLHPETELVAGCDPAEDRLAAFGSHYGITALYSDYRELLDSEKLDIVAIASRAELRPHATELAVARGAKAVITEKPMAEHLAGADRMVDVCTQAGVPLICGAISANHPAFAKARELLDDGAIGKVLSLDCAAAFAQHNSWIYLLGRPVDWVVGAAEDEAAVRNGEEFSGFGLIQFQDDVSGFVRPGAPAVRITGESGELIYDDRQFRLWQDVPSVSGTVRVEVPFPQPQLLAEWSILYGVDDLIRCIESGGEPRVSGRRVRDAMEVEIALRESHRRGHAKVELPLQDRSLGMRYQWFR